MTKNRKTPKKPKIIENWMAQSQNWERVWLNQLLTSCVENLNYTFFFQKVAFFSPSILA